MKREADHSLLAAPASEPGDAAEYWSEESGSGLEGGDDAENDSDSCDGDNALFGIVDKSGDSLSLLGQRARYPSQ